MASCNQSCRLQEKRVKKICQILMATLEIFIQLLNKIGLAATSPERKVK